GPLRLRRLPAGEARPASEPARGAPRARDDGRALRVAAPRPGHARGDRPGLRRRRDRRGARADEAVRGGRERGAVGAPRAARTRLGPRRVRAGHPGSLRRAVRTAPAYGRRSATEIVASGAASGARVAPAPSVSTAVYRARPRGSRPLGSRHT